MTEKTGGTENAMMEQVDNTISGHTNRLTMRDMSGGTCEFSYLTKKATLRLKRTCSLIALAIDG